MILESVDGPGEMCVCCGGDVKVLWRGGARVGVLSQECGELGAIKGKGVVVGPDHWDWGGPRRSAVTAGCEVLPLS